MASSDLYHEIVGRIEEKSLPPKLKREFHACNEDEKNSSPVIRVMQWNILAQALSNGSDNFVLCPSEALEWETRQLRIMEEILQYSPHIMCLQEVDKFDYINSNLQKIGYEGIWFPKPESPCLDFVHHTGPDGCAIFFLTEKLKLVASDSIVLKAGGCLTNQVSIICTFGFRNVSVEVPNFTVAVTHLKSKESYHELRMSQGSYLLKYIEDKIGSSPVIVCGDFNASPTEPIYQAFKSSVLDLTSASTNLSEDKSEPKYTTWKIRGSRNGHKEVYHTIDYIWYSKHFQAKSVLDIPDEEALGENKLPSLTYPSDHLSLVCDLQFNC